MQISKVYIIGTGGFAREIAEMLPNSNLNKYTFAGYISKESCEIGCILSKNKVIGSDDSLPFSSSDCPILIIGNGNPEARKKIAMEYSKYKNARFPNVQDLSCRISRHVKIGYGNIISYSSLISTNVEIGNFNLINWASSIGHDCKVGNFCVINPHAHISGCVEIGDQVLVGAGAAILEKVNVPESTKIGAGAVVAKNIDVSGTYVGIPAKLIK